MGGVRVLRAEGGVHADVRGGRAGAVRRAVAVRPVRRGGGEELAAAGGGAGDDGSVVVEVEAAIARHAAFCRALGCRSPPRRSGSSRQVRRLLRGAGEGGRKEKAKAVVVLEFHDA